MVSPRVLERPDSAAWKEKGAMEAGLVHDGDDVEFGRRRTILSRPARTMILRKVHQTDGYIHLPPQKQHNDALKITFSITHTTQPRTCCRFTSDLPLRPCKDLHRRLHATQAPLKNSFRPPDIDTTLLTRTLMLISTSPDSELLLPFLSLHHPDPNRLQSRNPSCPSL